MAISAEHEKLSQTDRIAEPAGDTLIQRLVDEGTVYVPRALTEAQFSTLHALLHCVFRQTEATSGDLSAGLEGALGSGSPVACVTACAIGLDELDHLSRTRAGYAFAELTPEIQDAILELVAAGNLTSTHLNLAQWLDELCNAAQAASLAAH